MSSLFLHQNPIDTRHSVLIDAELLTRMEMVVRYSRSIAQRQVARYIHNNTNQMHGRN
jgi:hypothetical protein